MKLNKIMLVGALALILGAGFIVTTNNEVVAQSQLSLEIQNNGTNSCSWNSASYTNTFSVSSTTGTVSFDGSSFTCPLENMAATSVSLTVNTLTNGTYGNLGVMTGTAGTFTQNGTLAGADTRSDGTVTSSFGGHTIYTKAINEIGTITKAFDTDVEVPAGQQAGTYVGSMTLLVS